MNKYIMILLLTVFTVFPASLEAKRINYPKLYEKLALEKCKEEIAKKVKLKSKLKDVRNASKSGGDMFFKWKKGELVVLKDGKAIKTGATCVAGANHMPPAEPYGVIILLDIYPKP